MTRGPRQTWATQKKAQAASPRTLDLGGADLRMGEHLKQGRAGQEKDPPSKVQMEGL